MSIFTVKTMPFLPDTATEITIQGPRNAVLRAVARLHGLDNEHSVEVRDSTNEDGTHVIVDRTQAESYPEYLAEVVPAPGFTTTIAQPTPAPVGTGLAKEMRAERARIIQKRDLARSTRAGWAESAARNGTEYAPHEIDLRRDDLACAAIVDLERTIVALERYSAAVDSLAEELAGMPDADRRVAERIAALPEVEPPTGSEERAVERARRDGVIR